MRVLTKILSVVQYIYKLVGVLGSEVGLIRPRLVKRSRYELENNKKELATDQGRAMGSTSKKSPSAKETRKTE